MHRFKGTPLTTSVKDPLLAQQARLLMAVLPVFVLMAFLVPLVSARPSLWVWSLGALALLAMIAWTTSRGYIQTAGIALVTCGWLMLTTISLVYPGDHIADKAWYAVLIVMAGTLINGRAAWVIAVVSIVTVSLMGYQTMGTLIVAEAMLPVFVVLALLVAISHETIREAFSHRQQIETTLRTSEERYRLLLDASPVPTVMTDATTYRIIAANPAGLTFFGVESFEQLEDAITDFFDLMPPKERPIAKGRLAQLLTGEQLPMREYEIRRVDGGNALAEVRSVIVDYQGRRTLVTVFNDITRRRQALDALRESEERYRTLLEASPVAMALTTDDNHIHYVNRHFIDLMGGSEPEDFLDRSMTEFMVTSVQATSEAQSTFVLPEDALWGESRLRRLDGEQILVEFGAVYVPFAGQQALLSVMQDITARREVEQERARADALKKELDQERQIVTLRDSFIAMMSHEFRTPLTVIRSSTGLLERYYDKLDDKRRYNHLSRISEQVKAMTAMLDDILLLSKANAGMLEFNPKLVHLHQLVERIVTEFEVSDDGTHIVVYKATGNPSRQSLLDPRLITHLLSNLLSNAAKYSDVGTIIEVTLTCDPGSFTLAVSDSGIGIPQEALKSLFQAFTRAKNADGIQGTGLGLPIVQRCAELHQGTITVESTVGQGTTFTVCLPYRSA